MNISGLSLLIYSTGRPLTRYHLSLLAMRTDSDEGDLIGQGDGDDHVTNIII